MTATRLWLDRTRAALVLEDDSELEGLPRVTNSEVPYVECGTPCLHQHITGIRP